MTGTGTQANPYVPATWEEFISCTDDSVYVELPTGGGTFDMNDYYPEGITSTINIKGFINGNGWTIKNAAAYTSTPAFRMSSTSSLGKIQNLNFLNFRRAYSPAQHSSLIEGSGGYNGEAFRNCRFSGMLENYNAYNSDAYAEIILLGQYATIERCSFNIITRGTGRINVSQSTNWNAILSNCNIVIAGECNLFGFQSINSYISGTVGRIEFINSPYDSVVDCVATSISNYTGSKGHHIIVNTDKYTGSLPYLCIGVSTEEMNDADYLASIGFPIQT